jgi:hypothetical protein
MKSFKQYFTESTMEYDHYSQRHAIWMLPNWEFRQVSKELKLHARYVVANPDEFGITEPELKEIETVGHLFNKAYDPEELAMERGAVRIDVNPHNKKVNIQCLASAIQKRKGAMLDYFRKRFNLTSSWEISVELIDGSNHWLTMDDNGNLRKNI